MQQEKDQKYKQKTKKKINKEMLKSILVNIVNAVLIVAVFIVLSKLPTVAEEVKTLRGQQIVSQEISDVAVLQAELEKNKDKASELRSIYVDSRGFSDFIKNMDELRASGFISNITYPSSNPVLNKDGSLGLPMLIEISGTKEEVSDRLLRLQKLPYILRPVNVELTKNPDDNSLYILRYGVFLYVDESLKQN